MHDPWVALTVMAMRTSRVRLGGIVMALPRHRPWLFARAATSVDRVSGGRLVLPIGLGALDDTGFSGVGEATDIRVRAERMDESPRDPRRTVDRPALCVPGPPLHVDRDDIRADAGSAAANPHLAGGRLAAGEVDAASAPLRRHPPQQAEARGRPGDDHDRRHPRHRRLGHRASRKPRRLRHRRRRQDAGCRQPAGADIVRPWADAGATWWTEADWGARYDDLRARVEAGPPRID